MLAPIIDRCPRCSNVVTRQHNDVNFWCTCGRHWPARPQVTAETAEIDDREDKIKVEVPDIKKQEKKARRGQNRRVVAYTFESRKLYLHRNNLTEAEIMEDEQGKEYWIKDNFYRGVSEKIYLPERYKKLKNR